MPRLYSYDGNEPYIFISYAHKDMELVYPVISQMQSDGYRVWFDEGIDPGTEWDETIAQSIDECGYFLAFVSNNYLDSNNCKDELNFARDLSKKSVLVYLEDVNLTRGMAMRMNRIQSIFKHFYEDESEFYKKLYSSDGIAAFTSGRAVEQKKQSEVRSKTINYDDGSTYTGEVNELDERHGKGVYRDSDGTVYDGEFKNDKYHGKGVLSYYDEVYEGEFKNGELDGYAVCRGENGLYYEGELLTGRCHGHGYLKNEDGDVYCGEFADDLYHGKGRLEYANGDVYEGDFANSERDGKGIFRCANGDVYEGEFKNDMFDGKGVLRFADGSKLEGTFEDGKFIS